MKTRKILLLIIFVFQVINCEEKQVFYRCGVNDEHIKPIPIKNIVPVKDDDRRLDTVDEFKDFNIYLDLINIKNDIKLFHLEAYESLFIESLNKAVETLESLLKVKKLKHGFTFKDEDIEKIKIPYWNKTMIGTNAIGHTKQLGIDLFIFGRFDDNMDALTLASAGPRYMDPDSSQPIVGVVNINTKVDYSKMNSKEYFQSIILHEFTHILGFLDDFFIRSNIIYNKTDENEVVRYYINSPKVLTIAKKYFDCQDIEGVELEESGGSGTVASHWEARILLGDYMNGVVYPDEQVISEFSLALLEDLGYYKANYYTGGLMRYGKHKGCDFIKNRCVDSNHEINPKFENEFYDSILSEDYKDASCTSGRQSRAYHAWWIYNNLPSYYQYFSDPTYGGFSPADYCPVSMGLSDESENAYYTGHCSSLGNGGYGTGIAYRVKETNNNGTHTITTTKRYYYTSEELVSKTGETYSDHSFCYQSSLIRNDLDFSSEVVRAICYESFCSELSLTIKINDDFVLCPRSGGKIEVDGYKGYFLCPDYNLICSGKVMCNNMFECVDKKSELKEESYNYDYTIKTSQNLEDSKISDSDNENNYELSDDGICPKNCKHCNENKKCKKCRDNFNFFGSKKNQEINCLSDTELSIGYYKENDIYYSCIPNCDSCSDDTTCTTCSDGFDYSSGKCIKKIENCEEYDDSGYCSKCVNNYAFKENDRTACLNKEENFDSYYTQDNGISYYPCGNSINSCTKCNYNSVQNIVKCELCSSNYALYETENICISKSGLDNTYYYLDETHINKCSNAIENCNECQNGNICSKCKNNFYMINDITNTCKDISNIQTNEYYLNNDQTMYYSCNNNLYQDIQKCKECSSKSICTLCQENYTFINGDKTICVEKTSLNSNEYVQDPNDISNYIKCENKYNNCNLCDNDKCQSCKEGYIFINEDYSKCILKSSINLDYYFTKDNIEYYSCREEKYKTKEECKEIIPLIPEETTPPKTSKPIDDDKNPLFEIFIIQVQIINKLLKIFLTSSTKLEKGFHFKFSIDLYKNNNIRNLEGSSYISKEIDFYLSNDDDESGEIISLTSQEQFDDTDRVVIKQEKNDEYEIKVLNNNNKILDTQENLKMIQNKEIINFSDSPSNYQINRYYIESSSKGCQFNLLSNNQIIENNQNIILNFVEKNNRNNKIDAKCTLSSDNEKNIPCTIDQEIKDKNCVLKDYVGSNSNGLFYIMQDKDIDNLQLNCFEDKSNNDKKTIIIIVIVVCSVAVISIIAISVCCCKKKKVEEIPYNTIVRQFNSQRNVLGNNSSVSNRRVKINQS